MVMKEPLFSNEVILSWLQYYAQNTAIDLEHVKMIDITKKNKNVIPTVEAHKTTLVFTNAGVDDIFYRLWNAGLGECDVWYNDGFQTGRRDSEQLSKGYDRPRNQCFRRNAHYQSERPQYGENRYGK